MVDRVVTAASLEGLFTQNFPKAALAASSETSARHIQAGGLEYPQSRTANAATRALGWALISFVSQGMSL
ncbi:hypothetical protein BN1232_02467 [Mycobacterium lentiflavum]|uniref:Uncharacterized protein n=1 Tax=Mycobacterium lentiflavum TaxID=141349 RepID=A0A0E4GY61_MYCLN|nr:hypothetical protein BN1232_02467 [Mycobacterium lentiflavum]